MMITWYATVHNSFTCLVSNIYIIIFPWKDELLETNRNQIAIIKTEQVKAEHIEASRMATAVFTSNDLIIGKEYYEALKIDLEEPWNQISQFIDRQNV